MSDSSEASTDPTAHVLIVGGGASGTTCALYLARAGITSTIFDSNRSILQLAELHNFPALPPTLGTDWLAALRAMVDATGNSTRIEGRVTAVEHDGEEVVVQTADGRTTGDYLVIASGQVQIAFADGLGLETTDPVQPYVQANIVVDRWGATSVDRVFACGVVAGFPSQALIAAGSGANVAQHLATVVRGEFWVDHDEPAKA